MPTHASSTTFFSPKYFPLDFIGGYHGKECPSPDYDFECPPPPSIFLLYGLKMC